jgi:primosomal protein N' (replication factor Y)
MHYYIVALPLKLQEEYVYYSFEAIEIGCRVIVSFLHRICTGVIFQEIQFVEPNITYKEIKEIIDEKPILSTDLIILAEWMKNYYHCSIGQALFAMLPAAFDVIIQQEVSKRKEFHDSDLSETASLIMQEVSFENTISIEELKKKIGLPKIQYWLETLEDSGFLKIFRTYDQKIKHKIANFVIVNKSIENFPILTEKQQESYDFIKQVGIIFPLAKITDKITYAQIKTLRNKGLLHIEPRQVEELDNIFSNITLKKKEVNLTTEQIQVVQSITKAMKTNRFSSFLLYGITGSGKTEVYIKLIEECLFSGKKCLLLVPEISLTPQLLAKFYAIFFDKIAVLHSHLNEREKWIQWKRIYHNEIEIVIGVRSAIFAPLSNIGLIIIDEEHETTYKQDKTPFYHARDVAVVRAKNNGAVVVLGSATPSLESWQNQIQQKYHLSILANRPYDATLADVIIIDLTRVKERNRDNVLSDCLAEKINDRLKKKEQIILFQNRRGHSSFVQCTNCGHLFTCPNCEISMNYHSYDHSLKCHYCGLTSSVPRNCPKCNSFIFQFGACGTQQVEKQLKIQFPTARILRMDSDTAHQKDSYTSMFDRMKNGHIDILLGTQMITKGLDFENVTLVGVISADTILNFPDFRSAERTFQLLTQVAGRSGRGDKKGEVVIQTYNPEHYAISLAKEQNYSAFTRQELQFRKMLFYPPYWRMARFVFSYKDEIYLHNYLKEFTELIELLQKHFNQHELLILGPTPTPLPKINQLYRQHIILKAKNVTVMNKAIIFLKTKSKRNSTIRTIIDVDPFQLL